MKTNSYFVQFEIVSDESGEEVTIPVMTTIHVMATYWNEISEEQKNDEIESFAVSQLSDIGLEIDYSKVERVKITEVQDEE